MWLATSILSSAVLEYTAFLATNLKECIESLTLLKHLFRTIFINAVYVQLATESVRSDMLQIPQN